MSAPSFAVGGHKGSIFQIPPTVTWEPGSLQALGWGRLCPEKASVLSATLNGWVGECLGVGAWGHPWPLST